MSDGRVRDASDVAYAALFLASHEAKSATGTELVTDGACRGKADRREPVDRGMIRVPAGALDDDPGTRPQRHIFVDFKGAAAWCRCASVTSLDRGELVRVIGRCAGPSTGPGKMRYPADFTCQ